MLSLWALWPPRGRLPSELMGIRDDRGSSSSAKCKHGRKGASAMTDPQTTPSASFEEWMVAQRDRRRQGFLAKGNLVNSAYQQMGANYGSSWIFSASKILEEIRANPINMCQNQHRI